MTNLEAFRVLLDDPNTSDARITSLLSVQGIDPNGLWVKSTSNPINCGFYDALINEKLKAMNLNTGIASISEGGMSISFSNASPYIKGMIESWAKDSGCRSLIDKYTTNKIKDVSHLLYRP